MFLKGDDNFPRACALFSAVEDTTESVSLYTLACRKVKEAESRVFITSVRVCVRARASSSSYCLDASAASTVTAAGNARLRI